MTNKLKEVEVERKGVTTRTRRAAITIPHITESSGSKMLREKNKQIVGSVRRHMRRTTG
jgi:hypothetical protein